MNIQPISTKCERAILTHFRLEIEASEIDELSVNPEALDDELQKGVVRLKNREHILLLSQRFLQTTLEVCETCDYYDPESPDPCPNINVLGFINDTLTI